MNKYLTKIAVVLEAKLGMPAGQKVPAQTLQVLKQVGDPNTRREAQGVVNLSNKGGHNKPLMTSKVPQRMPRVKMAETNLEKIALNAMKAREMAKKVGIVPDGHTQWKWALRHMRDNRGNPLKGKHLEKARQQLGFLSNESWKKLLPRAQKAGTQEIAAQAVGGKLKGKIHIGKNHGFAPQNNDTISYLWDNKTPKQTFIHSHPRLTHKNLKTISDSSNKRILKHLGMEDSGFEAPKITTSKDSTRYTHRNARPSGYYEEGFQIGSPHRLSQLPTNVRKEKTKEYIKMHNKYTKRMTGDPMKFVNKVMPYKDHFPPNGDVGIMAKHRPNRNYTILSPHGKIEGLHKTIVKHTDDKTPILAGHRSVYLKRK